MTVTVLPEYASIECVRDICEPWIELWGGDEWGESMRSLHGAAQTNYGFSDEDCALFASKLMEYIEEQKSWMDEEYRLFKFSEEEEARKECCRLRDYWRKGGGLNWEPAVKAANATLDTMPKWLFEEDNK